MKRVALAAAILHLIITPLYSQAVEDNELIDAMKTIIHDYSNLVDSYSGEAYFKEAHTDFQRKVDAGELSIKISRKDIDSLLSGLKFSLRPEGNGDTEEVFLTVYADTIDCYPEYQSIIYSMLTHELWHAYAYSQHPEQFKKYHTDMFEETLYEADAYFVEAEFIEKILVERGIQLTKFEEFLLRSYQQDSLNSFMIMFRSVDLSLIERFYGLRSDYHAGKISLDELYAKIIEIGKEEIIDFVRNERNDSDWKWYIGFTKVNSYQKYMMKLIGQVETSREVWGDVFSDYPELHSLYQETRAYVDQRIDKAKKHAKELQSPFKIAI